MFHALVRTDGPEGGTDATGPRSRRREPLAWWKLVAGLVAAIALIDLAQAAQGLGEVAILVAGLVVLGMAGWYWGADSRDGADWTSAQRP
jgi:hypothetical protein